jgi:hypothetical protein
MSFANPPWTAGANGQGMRHSELVGINLNAPPDLHHAEAIGFDFAVGWSTSHAKIDQGSDWFETVVKLAIIVGVGIATSGAMVDLGFGGTGLTAMVATGAAVGATTSGDCETISALHSG